jgi:hypothetical protein
MKRSMIYRGQGRELTKLLVAAAGLDIKRCKRLVCTLDPRQCISFEVELYADEDDIEKALKEVDATNLASVVAESVAVPYA